MAIESATLAAVQRSLLLGLGWISGQLQEFAFLKGGQAQSFTKEDVARLKPISELALTTWILKRCGMNIPFLDSVAEFIWQECENGQFLVKLLLARNDFLPCCAMYAPLHQIGYRCNALHKVLRMLAHSDMAAALPLQPWSQLAMAYNLKNLHLVCRTPQLKLYIESRPEPWVVSGELAYAITHEVFYLTDFGFLPLGNADIDAYLQTWVPYWVQAFTREKNNDLIAEFAMVTACVDAADDERFGNPLLALLKHQLPDGSLRGPKGAGSFLFSKDDSQERQNFLESYHTTLVMLMAAAMFLKTASNCNRETREDNAFSMECNLKCE